MDLEIWILSIVIGAMTLLSLVLAIKLWFTYEALRAAREALWSRQQQEPPPL